MTVLDAPTDVEGLLRQLAPRALGAVVRRYGHFADAEDAVQEALAAAATRAPEPTACRTTRSGGWSGSRPGA